MRSLRNDFSRIQKKYVGVGKENVRLTQSTLILAKNINSTKNAYQFSVLETEPVDANSFPETRLNINDEFIVTDLGLYYGIKVGGNVAGDPLNWDLATVMPVELSKAFAVSNGLYNGKLEVSVNNINYIDNWDSKKHEFRGVTQWQSSTAVNPLATLPNVDFGVHGMAHVTPNFVLSGAKKNTIGLELAQPFNTSADLVTLQNGDIYQVQVNAIVLIMRGFLAQNAAVFQGQAERGRRF